MTILFFETKSDEQPVFETGMQPALVTCTTKNLDLETVGLAADAEIVSVFVNSTVTREVLEKLPKLKYIATRSTGFDHIDCAAAKERGIQVANVPAYGSRTVAEFAFGLILNLSRKIFPARLQLLESHNFNISALQGFNLQGKTLGVVGTGRIGKNVIQIAKGFDMKILAYDMMPDANAAVQMGFEYADLPTVLAHADIVTLHAPYTEKTHHMIHAENIASMKPGSYIINTSRGELIDSSALTQALASGHIAGVGLDVLESEKQLKEEAVLLAHGDTPLDYKILFEDHVLLNDPRSIVTPHIAFYSKEAVAEIQKTTMENISAFIHGAPQNIVS